MPQHTRQRIIRGVIWLLPVLLLAWIGNRNLVLSGSVVLRCSTERCDSRIKKLFTRENQKIVGSELKTNSSFLLFMHNPLSFDVQLFRSFQKATVRLAYQDRIEGGSRLTLDTSASRRVELADSTALVTNLESSWSAVREGNQVLFQKKDSPEKKYASIRDFFEDFPVGKKIGVYNFDLASNLVLPSYIPSSVPVTTRLNLRGAHTFLAYVGENENLNFTFTMQNSNRNEGKDSVVFRVYHDINLLKTITLKDNGSGLDDGKPAPAQDVRILLPQPGRGLYRIEISSPSDDQFIRSFTTTQTSYTFQNKIYLAGSKEYHVLGSVEDSSLTLYVKGTYIRASTSHANALQTIDVNGKKLVINEIQTPVRLALPNQDEFFPVTIPIRDVVLETDGIFVLSPANKYPFSSQGIEELISISDPARYDYVLARYEPVERNAGWLVAEKTVTGEFSKSTRFTITSDPPIGTNGEPFRVKELKVTLKTDPFSFQDLKKGLKQIFGLGK